MKEKMLTEKLGIKVFTFNYVQKSDTKCVLTSVAEMEATFYCSATLLPQFHVEMFQRK